MSLSTSAMDEKQLATLGYLSNWQVNRIKHIHVPCPY